MFGYVRAARDALTERDKERYESLYCGLCHTLGKGYGWASRYFLNYDFVFLAMLLAPPGGECGVECRKCPRRPLKGRKVCKDSPWLETAAGESVLLTWWKLRDAIADGSWFGALAARWLCLFLGRAYRKARTAFPEFDASCAVRLGELGKLERENCVSIDQTADCFARLLQSTLPGGVGERRERILAQLLYHLGRWIYLVDAVDDWKADRAAGNYNPVLARFPEWTEKDRSYLRMTLDRSLDQMGAAFQLLEPTPYTGVMENVIYLGLPGVEELVFTGQWRKPPKEAKGGASHE